MGKEKNNKLLPLCLNVNFTISRYMYIVDNGNNRIVRWTDDYAAGGTCIVGCTGTTGTGATRLKGPRDLKFDASGNLYVSDNGNNRIQKYLIQSTPNCSLNKYIIFKIFLFDKYVSTL